MIKNKSLSLCSKLKQIKEYDEKINMDVSCYPALRPVAGGLF